MPLAPPLDLSHWLKDNAKLFQPPVNNVCLYSCMDFIVMVVGAPNALVSVILISLVFHYTLFVPLPADLAKLETPRICQGICESWCRNNTNTNSQLPPIQGV